MTPRSITALLLLAVVPLAACTDDASPTPAPTGSTPEVTTLSSASGSIVDDALGADAPDGGTEENPVVQENTPMQSSATD